MHRFQPGDRVRIRNKEEFGFPDGITGTITMPISSIQIEGRQWDGCRLTIEGKRRTLFFYTVEFDEPHDDGSGDGPYRASEINEENLELLSESL